MSTNDEESDKDTSLHNKKNNNKSNRLILSDSDDDNNINVNKQIHNANNDSNKYDNDKQNNKKKRIIRTIDSDSDDDDKKINNVNNYGNTDSDDSKKSDNDIKENNKKDNKKKRIIRTVDSDSDDNEKHKIDNSKNNKINKNKIKKNKSSKIQSSNESENSRSEDEKEEKEESEEEEIKTKRVVASKQKFKDILYNKLHKKKTDKNKTNLDNSKHSDSNFSDSEDTLGLYSNNLESPEVTKQNDLFSNKDLYDAESSDEDMPSHSRNPSPKGKSNGNYKSKGMNNNEKKKKKEKIDKPAKRKSSNEALEKIHAETQRLIRESNVSLPYFLPKPRSIEEFLQKRKPIPAIPLRAKGESLGTFINLYEERVKNIKEKIYENNSGDEEQEKEKQKNEKEEKIKKNNQNEINKEQQSEINKEKNDNDELDSNEKNCKDSIEVDQKTNLDESLNGLNKNGLRENINSTITNSLDKNSNSSYSNILDKATNDSENETPNNVNVETMEVDENDDDHFKENDNNSDNDCEDKIKTISNENQSGPNLDASETQISNNQSNEIIKFDESKSQLYSNENQTSNANSISSSTNEVSKDQLDSKNCQIDSNQESSTNNSQDKLNNSQIAIIKNQINPMERQATQNESQPGPSESQSTTNNSQSNIFSANSEGGIFSNFSEELMKEPNYVKDDVDFSMKINKDTSKQINENEIADNDTKQPVKKKLFSNWVDTIQPPSDDEQDTKQSSILTLNTSSIPTLKPSNHDDFIELDDDHVTNKTSNFKPGVLKLMERFSKHVSVKSKKKQTKDQEISLNITSTESNTDGNIINITSESLSIVLKDNVNDSSKQNPARCKPGAKLVKLKIELNKEMAKKREESWKRRIEEAKMNEETYEGEKSEKEDEFDEEEEEEDLEDITTEEEEEEELIREKPKRIKSAFIDEEAEVSEDDIDADDEDEEENADKENDDECDAISCQKLEKESPRSLKSKTKTFDMFLTEKNVIGENLDCGDEEEEEDELPGYQINNIKMRNMSTPAPQDKVIFSPVVTLTGCDKTAHKKLYENSFSSQISSPTQTANINVVNSHHSPKILNFDQFEDDLSPAGLDNLIATQNQNLEFENLFSGKFSSQNILPENLENDDEKCNFITQTQGLPQGVTQLLSPPLNINSNTNIAQMCSGAFTSQPIDLNELEAYDETCPNFITSQTQQNSDTELSNLDRPKEAKSSFLNKSSILSSDEDDVNTSMLRKRKMKRLRKLQYSDEEDDEKPNDLAKDEEEGEHDDDSNEDDDSNDSDDKVETESFINDSDEEESHPRNEENLEVEYDSEENEVVKKVEQFFEDEAELSESEWGSADEDENELDKMEQEEADKEYHDEDQLKEELGKIHMRQVLDDDNREVKMLQEILLEDGELHSDGPRRQRQFKWSNLDDMSDLQIVHLSGDSDVEDDTAVDEAKEDEMWRKARLERELFLEQQKGKLQIEESLTEDSISIDSGKTVVLNGIKNKIVKPDSKKKILNTESDVLLKSPDTKLHALMGLQMKRGSYLSRGTQSLARLAKITQSVRDEVDEQIIKKKGNFVFTTIDPDQVAENQKKENPEPKPEKVVIKRKPNLPTPPLLKKMKIEDNKSRGILSKLFYPD